MPDLAKDFANTEEVCSTAKPILEEKKDVFIKTARLTINLVTNILMCFTVFVCLVYACSSKVMTLYHWHIILCVLGYQFFMSQGTLVLSRYNSWSMHLSRRHKKHMHIACQLISFILVVIGSAIIACKKSRHFETIHGSFGLCAVIASFICTINGASANYAYKLSRSYVILIKYIHYLSGILTLFLSAGSLSAGFEGISFRVWASNDDAVTTLVFVTWVFTLFVALDFWVMTGNRLRNLL